MAPPVESERYAMVEREHRTSRLESNRSASRAKEAVIALAGLRSQRLPSFARYLSASWHNVAPGNVRGQASVGDHTGFYGGDPLIPSSINVMFPLHNQNYPAVMQSDSLQIRQIVKSRGRLTQRGNGATDLVQAPKCKECRQRDRTLIKCQLHN